MRPLSAFDLFPRGLSERGVWVLLGKMLSLEKARWRWKCSTPKMRA